MVASIFLALLDSWPTARLNYIRLPVAAWGKNIEPQIFNDIQPQNITQSLDFNTFTR